MSLTVRRMTLEDVPQVHAIELATFPTPWSEQSFIDEMTKNVCARYMVAEEDGEVIAAPTLVRTADTAFVSKVTNVKGHMFILLDLEGLMTEAEKLEIEEMLRGNKDE